MAASGVATAGEMTGRLGVTGGWQGERVAVARGINRRRLEGARRTVGVGAWGGCVTCHVSSRVGLGGRCSVPLERADVEEERARRVRPRPRAAGVRGVSGAVAAGCECRRGFRAGIMTRLP